MGILTASGLSISQCSNSCPETTDGCGLTVKLLHSFKGSCEALESELHVLGVWGEGKVASQKAKPGIP